MLYEIGDPNEYILPDVICDFSQVTINEIGSNEVLVSGAKGKSPSNKYKVSTTFVDGYRVVGKVVIGGKDALKKAEIVGQAIIQKTNQILEEKSEKRIKKTSISILGTNSMYPQNVRVTNTREVVLIIIALHNDKEALEIFSREIAQAVTGMVPGIMNFLGGRPSVSPSIQLYSYLIQKSFVSIELQINEQIIPVDIRLDGTFQYEEKDNQMTYEELETDISVPLQQLAYARSGDKGPDANIGVIARNPVYLPYIRNGLKSEIIKKYFSHLLEGEIYIWDVPGIQAINILLKRSLGGGGMSSIRIDPQGKAYAQQLLDIPIPFNNKLVNQVD